MLLEEWEKPLAWVYWRHSSREIAERAKRRGPEVLESQ
jgi:hypothetical protein